MSPTGDISFAIAAPSISRSAYLRLKPHLLRNLRLRLRGKPLKRQDDGAMFVGYRKPP
jgi:hypothetical protein